MEKIIFEVQKRLFKDDNNPQIVELYNRARGGYDAIDDIYYKLFHHYANID
jgi:hypothetical protein